MRRGGFDRPRGLLAAPVIVAVFLYAPIIVVVLFSFNSVKSLASFHSLSLHWYERLWHDSELWSSVLLSAEIAAISASAALLLGTALALAVRRMGRLGALPNGILTLTLITPEVALGFSLLLMFTTLGLPLSRWTVTAGHITFSLVYVALVVRARLAMLDESIEEAAQDLGASRLQTVRLVVLPQLTPALLGAAMLVYVLSFDDFVVSLFTTGVGTSPLPVRIYSMIRFGVTPEINAIATLMMAVSIAIGVVGLTLTRRQWGGSLTSPTAE